MIKDSILNWLSHDTFGAWWVDESGVGRSAERQASTFDPFAYRNYGLIKILIGLEGFEIRWDVQNVSDDALNTVAKWIASAQDEIHLKLTYYYFGWCSETVTKASAISRMDMIQKHRDLNLNRSLFMRSHDISQVPEEYSLLQNCLSAWHGPNASIARPNLLLLSDRFVIFRQNIAATNFTYEHIGTKSPITAIMGQKWALAAMGALRGGRLYPKGYRETFNNTYNSVMSLMEPRYDHILSAIQPPGGEPVWLSYHRLLLPSHDAAGRPILINVSEYGKNDFDLTG